MSRDEKQEAERAGEGATPVERLEKRVEWLEELLVVPEEESTEEREATQGAKTVDDRIQRLERAVGPAMTGLEMGDQLRYALVAGLQKDVEAKLVISPLFKGAYKLLAVSMGLGLVVWLGGAWYGGTQIKSVRQNAEAATERMEEVVHKVKTRANNIIKDKLLPELTFQAADFEKRKEDALKIIESVNLKDLENINKSKANELRELFNQKKEREQQLANLEQLDAVLGIHARTARAVWVLLAISVVALVLSVVSLLLWWKS